MMTIEKVKNIYSDEVRLALLEQSINNIDATLIRFEKRFDSIDNEFKDIKTEFKEVRKEMKSDFRWIFGLTLGLGGTGLGFILGLGGIMAHGFHWF